MINFEEIEIEKNWAQLYKYTQLEVKGTLN